MGTNVVAVFALIAIVLLLLLARLSFHIDKIPGRLFALVKQERAREDSRAQSALLEAAALKVGPLVAGIRTYHEQLAASLHAQLAEAETRARVAERRALDASTYLGAASTLVGDLRGLRDEMLVLVRRAEATPLLPPGPSADAADADQRVTIALPHPAPVASRVRAVAPLDPAPALPVEPAMVAARLVPRGGSESARPSPRRARTLPGAPDARRELSTPPPPATTRLDDSADWMLSERPSDPEGERTRVGPHPAAGSLGLPALKATLPSMKAAAPPTPRAVAAVAIEGAAPEFGGAA